MQSDSHFDTHKKTFYIRKPVSLWAAGLGYIIGVLKGQRFKSTIFIYSLWVILHFVVPHIYTHVCVPKTISGFILSIFVAPAPHCQIMRWTIYTSGNMINMMWLCIGTWIVQKLIPEEKKQDP